MAYRNHPTRYLIVKDRVASPAVAGGQQEVATYAALNPASSTFFQNPPTRLSAAALAVSRSGGRIYAAPSGPSSTFFQSPFRPFGDPAALPFFAARRELLRIPARPVNTFFHSTRATVVPRSASPVSVGAEERVYARPPGPSTLFFNPAQVSCDPRSGPARFPAAGEAVYAGRGRASTVFWAGTALFPAPRSHGPRPSIYRGALTD